MLLLAGPTASGKSALAVEWAKARGGRVVNADSMQVYSDLRTLTARPSEADEATAAHRLYGHVDAGERFSVGRWLRAAIDELKQPGPLVLVGGTGLYFDTLENGLAPVPHIPDEVRRRWNAMEFEQLRVELRRRDPQAAAKLDPSDRQRIQRAIEVHDVTGRTLASWWADTVREDPLALRNVARIVIEPDRPALRDRISARFERMMREGAVEEVGALLARGLDSRLPAMRAIGMREIASMLLGEATWDEAVERSVIASRQYAKRQSTWFRNRFDEQWLRVSATEEARASLGLA